MPKLFVFVIIMLAGCLVQLESSDTIAVWSENNICKTTEDDQIHMTQEQQKILDRINKLPMPFTSGTVDESNYTVQIPHFWMFKENKNFYHAAVLFENSPQNSCPDSQRFLALFVVWKNGQVHHRQVIENDPNRIKITSWQLQRSSDNEIYLTIDYSFTPYFTDTFADQKNKCRVVFHITQQEHAPIVAFEALPIGGLTIKNGVARANKLPQPNPQDFDADASKYRRNNPVYQIVYPHCFVTEQDNHTYHLAVVDRQHEDLLTVYIWKDRKLHSIYLLDHYEQFYSTPERMKITSEHGSTKISQKADGQTRLMPIFESIYLKYVLTGYSLRDDYKENTPTANCYKFNRVTIHLQKSGTFDMRQQHHPQGFRHTPQLQDK